MNIEKLKGKSVLIGREPNMGHLLVAVQGADKCTTIGAQGSVPPCVSRCRPAQGTAHAKMTVDQSGFMTLVNMNPQNVTYVNGNQIQSKRVTVADVAALGKDQFVISLSEVVHAASGLLPEPAPPKAKFDISHLEGVWTDFQEEKIKIQEKQKNINLVRSGCGLFTLCAMPCIHWFGPVGYVLTGIGVLGNLYSFIGLKNDNTTEKMEKLNEKFQDRYVCPNPDCKKFLGNISYKLLKKQYSMHCPYCKSEYVE